MYRVRSCVTWVEPCDTVTTCWCLTQTYLCAVAAGHRPVTRQAPQQPCSHPLKGGCHVRGALRVPKRDARGVGSIRMSD